MRNSAQSAKRLNRSQLAVPGNREELFEKALNSRADIILLDLEDSVAPGDKERARRNAVTALRELDWSHRSVSVRINGTDTPHMYRDLVDIVEQAGDKLDLVMLPKAECRADVRAVDMLIGQIEAACGFDNMIGLELVIETALGVENAMSLAAASPRIESLHFGVADYAASIGARNFEIGGVDPGYAVLGDPEGDGSRRTHSADMWHYPMVRIALAARANGVATDRRALSAIFPTRPVSRLPCGGRQPSVSTGNGPSIPARLRRPTMS